MPISRCFRLLTPHSYYRRSLIHCPRRFKSSHNQPQHAVETDATGIPVRPTWSVNELLTSYPKPTISPATLTKLHSLSALIPPNEGTDEHKQLTIEMENLVKLVEAVKLVDTSTIDKARLSNDESVPDGRIWAEGTGIDLHIGDAGKAREPELPSGQSLLKHAARTENGMYVVDTDRRR